MRAELHRHAVAFGVRLNLPVLAFLQQLAERLRSRPVQKRVELHVAAHARSKVVAVGLAQRVDTSCTVLVANLPVVVPATIIEAGVTILRHSHSPINWGRAMPGPVSQGALVERQQIVVPDAVGIGAKVWVAPCRPHHANVRPLPVLGSTTKKVLLFASMLWTTRSRGHVHPAFGLPRWVMCSWGLWGCGFVIQVTWTSAIMAPFRNGHETVLNSLCGRWTVARTAGRNLFSCKMSEVGLWPRIGE